MSICLLKEEWVLYISLVAAVFEHCNAMCASKSGLTETLLGKGRP